MASRYPAVWTDRRAAASLLCLALALAGCGRRDKPANGEAAISFTGLENAMDDGDGAKGVNAAAADETLSLTVPGFSAKLTLPGLSLGARDTEIDGIRFHPGTRITGLNVTGHARDDAAGKGVVEMRFTDPAAPDALIAYYREIAPRAGWTIVAPAPGERFAATKVPDRAESDGSERLGLAVTAAGRGSTGRFLVTGG